MQKLSYYLAKLVLILLCIYIYIMGYRRITRGRKAPSGKGKGKGTSKFKTRYRKMRGGYGHGDRDVTYPEGAQLMSCTADESKLGGVYSEHSYDMDRYEAEVNSSIQGKGSSKSSRQYVVDPPPRMFKGSSNGLRTEYVSKRMRMGFFTQSTFSFQRGSLFNIGLVEILKDKPRTECTSIQTCKDAFFASGQDNDVIHDNTAYVFFGGFAKKRGTISYEGVKQGLGLCYNVENAEGRGRLYMGYWYQDKMNGLGIEVDFGYVYGNPITPVGIYFGHFIQGKRKGYGIYYNVEDGTENFVFYTGDEENRCVTSASYQGPDEKKHLFETTVQASLVMNFVDSEGKVTATPTRNARHVTLKGYLERLRSEFDKFIETMGGMINMGGMIKKMSGDDKLIANEKFKPVYTKFVNFCFDGVYGVVREAYVAVKDKDEIAKKVLLDAEAKRQEARALLEAEEGMVITDTKEGLKVKEEIDKCVAMLTEASYDVKSPEKKAEEADALKAEKLGQYDSLQATRTELEKLKQRNAFVQEMQQSGYNEPEPTTFTIGNLGRSGRWRSPMSQSQPPVLTPVARNLASSLDAAANDTDPLQASQKRSGGGGKRTRKNMRMRTRAMNRMRKSRRGGGQCGMKP